MFSRSLVLTFSSVALVGLCQATTPVVTTVEAQSRPVNRIRFAEMDRNNDGVITRQEWNGSARSFEVHDWNNDGRLSGEEVRVGAQRNTNWETADHNPNRWERNLSWTRSAFTNLDHNRDGRLTDNEWHFDRETFLRVDRNRDNAITVAEFLGEGVDDLRGDNFDDLDRNNNGRVERTEWYGGANEFRWLDRNGDGFLTRYEVAGSQPSLTHLRRVQQSRLQPQRPARARRVALVEHQLPAARHQSGRHHFAQRAGELWRYARARSARSAARRTRRRSASTPSSDGPTPASRCARATSSRSNRAARSR